MSSRQSIGPVHAKAIAAELIAAHPSIEGICLFGSVARGDARATSDIDLLVLSPAPTPRPSELLRALSPQSRSRRISLLVYTSEDFETHYANGALFVAHVLKEGKALYDPTRLLSRLLGKPFTANFDVKDQLATQLERLRPYEVPSRFGDNFLFCLAHLYSIGKGVVMLRLAEKGVLEFNKDRAFRELARLRPELREELSDVGSLKPFYELVTDRRPESLPFSYRSASRHVTRSVRAIKRLAAA